MWIKLALFSLCLLAFPFFCHGAENLPLEIRIGDSVVKGELEYNSISRQLLELSPMEMEMKDYNGQERIGYPSKKLSTSEVQSGHTPREGDIALFAPWGNLCVYIKDAPYSDSLIYLGRITSGLENLKSRNDIFKCRWIISPEKS